MSTPTREPGFLYIETPEEKQAHEPKREGDEFWATKPGKWHRATGNRFSPRYAYRRPLPVPAEALPPVVAYWPAQEPDADAEGLRKRIAELEAELKMERILRLSEAQAKRERGDMIANLEPFKQRLEWLHTGGGRDASGCEWGVFRVKWDAQGQPVEVWQTNSDFSDLDAEMRREAAPRAETQDEIDRKKAEELCPYPIGSAARKEYVNSVAGYLKAEREAKGTP